MEQQRGYNAECLVKFLPSYLQMSSTNQFTKSNKSYKLHMLHKNKPKPSKINIVYPNEPVLRQTYIIQHCNLFVLIFAPGEKQNHQKDHAKGQ